MSGSVYKKPSLHIPELYVSANGGGCRSFGSTQQWVNCLLEGPAGATCLICRGPVSCKVAENSSNKIFCLDADGLQMTEGDTVINRTIEVRGTYFDLFGIVYHGSDHFTSSNVNPDGGVCLVTVWSWGGEVKSPGRRLAHFGGLESEFKFG